MSLKKWISCFKNFLNLFVGKLKVTWLYITTTNVFKRSSAVFIGLVILLGVFAYKFGPIYAVTQRPYRTKPIRAAYYNIMDEKRDYYRQTHEGLTKAKVKVIETRFYVDHGVENYLLTRGNSPRFIEAGKRARQVIWRFFNSDTGDCTPQHLRALHRYFSECRLRLLNLKQVISNYPHIKYEATYEKLNSNVPTGIRRGFLFEDYVDGAIACSEWCLKFLDRISSEPEGRPSPLDLELFVRHFTNFYHFSMKLESTLIFLFEPPWADQLDTNLALAADLHSSLLGLQFILQDSFLTILVTV